MTLLNAFLARAFDVLLSPFEQLSPVVGLLAVSIPTALAMLLVVKATSNQQALADVKRAIHASIFEIRLFKDDLRAILRAQADILRHNVTYLRLSLVPMLWMIVPFAVFAAHLDSFYGYSGLPLDRPVLLKVTLRDSAALVAAGRQDVVRTAADSADRSVLLSAAAGLEVESPAVWIPATGEVVWRIRPKEAGDYEVGMRIGGETLTKTVRVSDSIVSLSPRRPEAGLVNQLLYPAEPPLAKDASATALSVAYPERRISVLGYDVHWLVVYVGFSILFALIFRKPLGVTL